MKPTIPSYTINGYAINYEYELHLAYFTQYGIIVKIAPENFTYDNILKILNRLSVLSGKVDHI